MTQYAMVKLALDSYEGTQLNIDSEAARKEVAEHVVKTIKHYESQDEFWKEINEDI